MFKGDRSHIRNNIECFVFGRRNTGYFDLRHLDGTKVHASAKAKQKIPLRLDDLKEGVLIGKDIYDRDVRLPFRNLQRHIMIEGVKETGKSHFGKLLASKAIEEAGMKVIVMDTGIPHSIFQLPCKHLKPFFWVITPCNNIHKG